MEYTADYNLTVLGMESCVLVPGGGGSTPVPPPDYNPCDGTPTPVSSRLQKGTTLAVLQGTPCDGGDLPPPSQPISAESDYIISTFNLQGDEQTYIINNPAVAGSLFTLMDLDDFSFESRSAAAITIKAGASGTFSPADHFNNYQSLSATIPGFQNVDHEALTIHIMVQSIIVRAEHPDCPEWKVYWEVSKEMVHLLLDGVGLVPGFGEIADLANGAIYTIEGDGINASLSYASAIPIVGWGAAGIKFAKKGLLLANGSKTTLKWVKKSDGLISFGNRN